MVYDMDISGRTEGLFCVEEIERNDMKIDTQANLSRFPK